jgi:hypothetical protein
VCDQKSFSQQLCEVELAVEKELKAILDECSQDQIQLPVEEGMAKIQDDLADVEQKIQHLVELMLEASSVTMKYINAELEKLENKKYELLQAQQAIKDVRPDKFEGLVWDELSFEEKKMTARAFIERIDVLDDSIEIVWKV